MKLLRDGLFRSRPKKDRVQSPASNDATNARSTSPDTAAGTKLSTSPAVEPEIVTPLPTKERTIEPSLQKIHVPDAGLAQKLSSASKADAPGSRGSRNLWAEALSKLKNDEPDIHHEFQAILEAEAAGLSTAPDKVNEDSLRSLIDEKLATIKQKEWILSFGSKSVHVRTVIERCLGFITGSKDLLTQAGALDPVHAGLPVAALCLIVSEKLINRDKEQNKDLAEALETTASIVQRYVATEQVYISHIEDPNAQFVDSITSLYTKILLLEAKLIIHLSANTGSRALKNVMGRTDWGADVKSVLQADEACEKLRGIAVSAIATQRHHQLQELLKSLNSQNLDFWRDYRHEQQQYYRSDRARACMTLLRAITYEDYKDRNPEPSDGTCRWFKTDTRFRNWLKEPGYSCLWVTADPGCGKSVLSKHLVDCYLGQQFGSDTTICYYFFKNEGTASCGTNAICSLLHQIFSNEPTKVLMHHIESDYQNNGDKLAGLFDRLWSVFQAVVKDNCAGRIVCVLDAFDECAPDDQRRLWKKFKSLAEKDRSLGSLKLLITSRPHIADAIEPELHESVKFLRLTGEAGEVSGGISREIENVIDQRLEDFRLKRQERGFKDSAHLQIRKSILRQGKNRTYLWVSFIFQDLFDHVGSPFPDLQAIFEQLPSTVEEQYEKILSTSKDRNLALKLLKLVIGAPKPMDPQHLYVRLLSTDTVSNIDHLEPPDTKPLHEYLRRLCGCFISITLHEDQQLSGDGSSKYKDRHDPEQYTVHLIHESAREFLVERHGDPAGEGLSLKWQWKGVISGQDAYHKWIESCLCFIIVAHQVHMANADGAASGKTNYDVLSKTPEDTMIVPARHRRKLIAFRQKVPDCSLPTWVLMHLRISLLDLDHVCLKVAKGDVSSPDACTSPPLVHLLRRICCEIPWKWFSTFLYGGFHYFRQFDCDWTSTHKALFLAIFFDLAGVVDSILEQEPHLVNVIDPVRSLTPFTYSLLCKSDKCIADFCERSDVSVATTDHYGGTALHRACRSGSPSAVRYVLSKKEVNVNARDEGAKTALISACEAPWSERSTEVVRELLKLPSLDVNLQDSNGRTALVMAALTNSKMMRELLKSSSLDVNLQDSYGLTALMIAASRPNAEVVCELLTLHSLDVNLQSSWGETALMKACSGYEGNTEVVRELLKSPSLDVNLQDCRGESALMKACSGYEGNTEVVRELLKLPSLDVNVRNGGGRTALHLAALGPSFLDILVLLVDDSRVDVNAQDETGMTALMLATRLISPVRITVLLQCRQLDVNIRTGEGDTALLMCLKTAADSLDREKSPYQWVKWLESFLQCVQLLLAAPETDINIRNVDGEHAVFLAAMIPLPPLHQLLERYGLDLSEPMQLQTLRPPQADMDVLKAAQDWLFNIRPAVNLQ
ncbi:ankyrin repeat-containing domain protein [Exophiala viscosa]|uniref:ankyrin repeat-containing domain protein n=1 Tax=Exophiala viscosa TaxID=2486360 RepID=UPI00218CFF82|nr:ankyrin repeat-containing domain protein [Exophiala viscosa]